MATPAPGTVCVESYVLVRRGYAILGGGSIARSKAPWNAFAQTVRVEFTGAEDPDVTELRFGFGELDGDAAVDTVHLTVASAAFRLPMSDVATPAASIFNNHFVYIDVPHGACAQ